MLLKYFLITILIVNRLECFIPSQILEFILQTADDHHKKLFGEVSESFTHEEIIKRGVIRSIINYFQDQPRFQNKVNLSKLEEYNDIKVLYTDLYGKTFCKLDIEEIILEDLEPNVRSVDFDKETKDLPYAHFDAEKFQESNQRVINHMAKIYDHMKSKQFDKARHLSAKILHTIQDFYSHSNWVEMGNHKNINKAIGTLEFNKQPIANKNDTRTCIENCTKVEVKCNALVSKMIDMLKAMKKTSINCPIVYYKCKGNIYVRDKLVSGFYVNQALPDGSPVAKSIDQFKCSHGGIMDSDAFKPAEGGINKDSGYFLFSPHAGLHIIAARLAVLHTEYFFDELRKKFGDETFAKFLRIRRRYSILNKINKVVNICEDFNEKLGPIQRFFEYVKGIFG